MASRKLIVVINGKGGVGKDTLCNALEQNHHVLNISAIDPIKEIARHYGWNGEKDNKSRQFLAELKQTFIHYNDLPTRYLKERTNEFLNSNYDVLFVHIREADQIQYYLDSVYPQKCITILVKRLVVDNSPQFGNNADDKVDEYSYDYVFHNDLPVEESTKLFCKLIDGIE